jgi:catechol 2,3-dioxygenase-like lactoylglutathione lyase family enzyme
MDVRRVSPILNVSSILESQAWFEALGWKRGFVWPPHSDDPGFGGVYVPDGPEIFLCRGAQGSRGGPPPRFPGDDDTEGVWMSWWVETSAEVDEAHALAQRLGFEVTYPPTDEEWGVREFHLRHPDGHMVRVGSVIQD